MRNAKNKNITSDTPHLLRVEEVAKYLGYSPNYIRNRYVSLGLYPVQAGRGHLLLFDPEDVALWIQKNRRTRVDQKLPSSFPRKLLFPTRGTPKRYGRGGAQRKQGCQ